MGQSFRYDGTILLSTDVARSLSVMGFGGASAGPATKNLKHRLESLRLQPCCEMLLKTSNFSVEPIRILYDCDLLFFRFPISTSMSKPNLPKMLLPKLGRKIN